jgi:hypothetical protein
MQEQGQISEFCQEFKFTVVVLELSIGRSIFKSGAPFQKTYVSCQEVPSGYRKQPAAYTLILWISLRLLTV